jgi:hypothetical protein
MIMNLVGDRPSGPVARHRAVPAAFTQVKTAQLGTAATGLSAALTRGPSLSEADE